MHQYKKGLALLSATLLTACATVELQPFSIDEYGVATRQRDTMTKFRSEEYGSHSRKVKFAKIIETTDTIKAELGTSFGYVFTVKGSNRGAKVTGEVVGIIPELTNPKNNKTFSTYSYPFEGVIGEDYYQGYTFDHEWELVPGDWTIQVKVDNRVMVEKTFTVIK